MSAVMSLRELARRTDYAEYQMMRARDAGNRDAMEHWEHVAGELGALAAAAGLARGNEGFYYAPNAELNSGVCDW